MTTQTTKIDWNKVAQVTGVVLIALGKATWWVAKHAGLIVVAVVTALFKVFMALISVWASMPNDKKTANTEYVNDGEAGYDSHGRLGYGPDNIYR